MVHGPVYQGQPPHPVNSREAVLEHPACPAAVSTALFTSLLLPLLYLFRLLSCGSMLH